MKWTVDYQDVAIGNDGERRASSAWKNLDALECRTTAEAWNYLAMIRISTGLDYYAAMVRQVR